MPVSFPFHAVAYGDIPGWLEDDHDAAFAAFCRSAAFALNKPYRTGALGVDASAFTEAFTQAARIGNQGISSCQGQGRDFFERFFTPFRVETSTGADGFVTGFYEPELEASLVRTPHFSVPLLGVPDDLIKLDANNRPDSLACSLAYGRMSDDGVVEYFDRSQIEQGALGERAKPLAWLSSKIDAFFVHVQGCVRLRLLDGSVRRLTYAAKSGHDFTGPGRVLAGLGEIEAEAVTMQSIRAWFRDNPSRVDEILHRNRSYIFFRQAEVDDLTLGPIAAAKVPLTPGRSLAVDRLLHTFATPFFIDAPSLDAFGSPSFRRLMIAQDTGSAIIGPARGDLFAGCGDAAGEKAGIIRHKAQFYALLPHGLVPPGGPI